MEKTVIAALVAKDLEAEFKRYTNSELQFIANVNDGQHGECKPLPEPTEGQLAEAFKVQRYDWWNALFDERVTLDQAAGMLLGFSQIMAMNAKFVDAHKSNPRAPSRPVSSYLVKAFTDMRGDIADWRVTSDGKYRAADLIAWAKEKGYVADEVLAAWDAHNQPDTVEAGQVTAPATPEAVEPEPQTAQATKGNTPRVEHHTTKGKRRDTLTPVIEHAQSLCKNLKQDEWDTAGVWGQLHTLTAKKYSVLLHLEGDAVVYTDGDNTKRLTKKMLGDRLRNGRKRLANTA